MFENMKAYKFVSYRKKLITHSGNYTNKNISSHFINRTFETNFIYKKTP